MRLHNKEDMQGLPAQILTKSQVKSNGTEAKGVVVNGKANEVNTSETTAIGFASLFESLVNPESKNSSAEGELDALLNGKKVSKEQVKEEAAGNVGNKQVDSKGEKELSSSESKIDFLLKNKNAEQVQKTDVALMTAEQAMPEAVLKNINGLLDQSKNSKEITISNNISKTSSGLEQLLNTLKAQKEEVGNVNEDLPATQIEGTEDAQQESRAKSSLDFILQESKSNDVVRNPKIKSEMTSKLGISGEDFVKNFESVNQKNEVADSNLQLKVPAKNKDENILDKLLGKEAEPKENISIDQMVQKQMSHSMKSYGQKQDILNNKLIKNTNDLAFKDKKTASADELKTPELKIGASLSLIKEPMIPVMMKQENQSGIETKLSGQVLDLSKIDTSNTSEIIKRISNYIEQSQVAGKDSLDLTVKHDSLGQFNIQVNRPVGSSSATPMDMQITTTTPEGHEFFMKHEVSLMKNLNQAGVQLSDLKIVSNSSESMSFTQSDSKNSNNNSNGNQAPREFMSFDSGDHSQGSARRKALWDEYQQKYGA